MELAVGAALPDTTPRGSPERAACLAAEAEAQAALLIEKLNSREAQPREVRTVLRATRIAGAA